MARGGLKEPRRTVDAGAPMIRASRSWVAVLATALLLAVPAVRAANVADITDVSPKVDEAPTPVKTVMPGYPDKLRKDGVSGIVSVVVVVDEQGEVAAAEVSKSTHDAFTEPALDAVRRWKFKPAVLAGKAVKVRLTIPLRFNPV